MDRSHKKKHSSKKSSSKEDRKRSSRRHKHHKREDRDRSSDDEQVEVENTMPAAPPPPLEDIIQQEMTNNINNKVKVSKGPVGVKPVSDEQEEATTEEFQKVDAADAAVTDTTVLASEIHEALENTKQSVGNGRGGDYSAAYQELYAQLCVRMVEMVYNYFHKEYKMINDKRRFKEMLEGVGDWNQKTIQKRAKAIVSKYKDTEYYFRFAYAANLMLMSVVVQKDESSEDVEIEVPKFSEFVHRVYLETARFLYAVPGVLDSKLDDHKKLRVREDLFICIGKAIGTALRMMVPLDVLMKNHNRPLENFDNVESEEEDDFSDPESDSASDVSSESGSLSDARESYGNSESGDEQDDSGSVSSGSYSEGSYSDDFDSQSEDDVSESEEDLPPPPPPRREKSAKHRPSKQQNRKVSISKRALETPDALGIDERR